MVARVSRPFHCRPSSWRGLARGGSHAPLTLSSCDAGTVKRRMQYQARGGADMTRDEEAARSLRAVYGFAIGAVDGEIGSGHDAYCDDRCWRLRYLVVDTGYWPTGRRVLLSPPSLRGVDHEHATVLATLSRAEVASSADIDTEKPVSRQHEMERFQYY